VNLTAVEYDEEYWNKPTNDTIVPHALIPSHSGHQSEGNARRSTSHCVVAATGTVRIRRIMPMATSPSLPLSSNVFIQPFANT
jgi:hypothetical protein